MDDCTYYSDLQGALLATLRLESPWCLHAVVGSIDEKRWGTPAIFDVLDSVFDIQPPCKKVFVETALRALMGCRLQGGGRFLFHRNGGGRWCLGIRWPHRPDTVTLGSCGCVHAFGEMWEAEGGGRWSCGRAAWLAAATRVSCCEKAPLHHTLSATAFLTLQ